MNLTITLELSPKRIAQTVRIRFKRRIDCGGQPVTNGLNGAKGSSEIGVAFRQLKLNSTTLTERRTKLFGVRAWYFAVDDMVFP